MKALRGASKPNLSFIILACFLVAFAIARVFTFFFPSAHLVVRGLHVHHFWFGLALLTVGGWLGINYRDEHVERIAAILFGTGGGLVGDEIGLLITFRDYYSEITYTFIISLLVFAFMAALFVRHGPAIISELYRFFRPNADLYVGLFLAIVSSAFLIQSENLLVIAASGATLLIALALITRRILRHFKRI